MPAAAVPRGKMNRETWFNSLALEAAYAKLYGLVTGSKQKRDGSS